MAIATPLVQREELIIERTSALHSALSHPSSLSESKEAMVKIKSKTHKRSLKNKNQRKHHV